MPSDPYKYFRIEARELLEGLNQGVLELERNPTGKSLVGRLLRLAHTLKGASRVVKQNGVADAAHSIEDALAPHRDAPGGVPNATVDELLRLLDGISGSIKALDSATERGSEGVVNPPLDNPFQTVQSLPDLPRPVYSGHSRRQ